MLMEQTLHTLKALRLPGMASAFEEQQSSVAMADLSFDERFGLLVDREHTWRENRRLARLLREARLKSAQACVEDIRYGGGRQLDKSLMAQLATCQWIHQHQNLVLTGATGCGKTWLACAFGNAACRQGLSVAYVRTPRLFEELRIAHGDGSFGKRLAALAKTDLLILDDWGLAPLGQAERNDLLEVLDDRVGTRSTLITSQLPAEHWHAYLNDPTLADAILDRVLHAAHTRVRQLITQASDFIRCCFTQCHYSKVSCSGRLGFARFKAAKTWVCSLLVVDSPALGWVPFRVMR